MLWSEFICHNLSREALIILQFETEVVTGNYWCMYKK